MCLVLSGGTGQSTELPLSQPPQPTPPSSASNTMRTNSCPGTPEIQRRREEAVRRLAAKVKLVSLHAQLSRAMLILSCLTGLLPLSEFTMTGESPRGSAGDRKHSCSLGV